MCVGYCAVFLIFALLDIVCWASEHDIDNLIAQLVKSAEGWSLQTAITQNFIVCGKNVNAQIDQVYNTLHFDTNFIDIRTILMVVI